MIASVLSQNLVQRQVALLVEGAKPEGPLLKVKARSVPRLFVFLIFAKGIEEACVYEIKTSPQSRYHLFSSQEPTFEMGDQESLSVKMWSPICRKLTMRGPI